MFLKFQISFKQFGENCKKKKIIIHSKLNSIFIHDLQGWGNYILNKVAFINGLNISLYEYLCFNIGIYPK